MKHLGKLVKLNIMLLALEAHKCWGHHFPKTFYDQGQVPFYQRFRNEYKPLGEPTYTVSQTPRPLVYIEDLVVEVGDKWEELQEAENLVVLQEFSFEGPITKSNKIQVQDSTVPINDATAVQVENVASAGAEVLKEVLSEAELEEVSQEAEHEEVSEEAEHEEVSEEAEHEEVSEEAEHEEVSEEAELEEVSDEVELEEISEEAEHEKVSEEAEHEEISEEAEHKEVSEEAEQEEVSEEVELEEISEEAEHEEVSEDADHEEVTEEAEHEEVSEGGEHEEVSEGGEHEEVSEEAEHEEVPEEAEHEEVPEEDEVMVGTQDKWLVTTLDGEGEVSTNLNMTGDPEQDVSPVETRAEAAGQALNLLDSTPSPPSPGTLTALPLPLTPIFGASDGSTAPSPHTHLKGIDPMQDNHKGQGHLAVTASILPGGSQTEPMPASISQTTSTLSPQLPSRQDSVPTMPQTIGGLDPLDSHLQHPHPVPSTFNGQTTSSPQQPIDLHMHNAQPRPTISPIKWHNNRQRLPFFSAPHMAFNPPPRISESFLGADPAHPRGGRQPWSWMKWVQDRPIAPRHPNSWTHSSQRRDPSHL